MKVSEQVNGFQDDLTRKPLLCRDSLSEQMSMPQRPETATRLTDSLLSTTIHERLDRPRVNFYRDTNTAFRIPFITSGSAQLTKAWSPFQTTPGNTPVHAPCSP